MHALLRTEQPATRDRQITRIGFGAWAVDGGWSFGWGPEDDTDSIEAIRHALEVGIDWIDATDIHDLEDVDGPGVGLCDVSLNDRSYVFTRYGLVSNEQARVREPRRSRWPASIRWLCEESLRQLGVERVDLYQLHSRPGSTTSPIVVAWTLTSRGVARAILSARAADQIESWVNAATLVLARANQGEIATAIGRTGAGQSPQLPCALAA